MDFKALLQDAIQTGQELPAGLQAHLDLAIAFEEHQFDQSYLEFLDEQIHLSPRGAEWTMRLQRRRNALEPYCDVPLVRCRIPLPEMQYTIEIHPIQRKIVHWKEYRTGG